MKFLLINNNHVVSKLATLSADKSSVELAEYDDPSVVPQDNYDVLIFDSEIFKQEFFDELKSRFDFSKTIFIYSAKSEPVEGFDMYLKKPFLPTELVDLISRIKSTTDAMPKDSLMDDEDLSIDAPDIESGEEINDLDDLFAEDEKDSSEDIHKEAAQKLQSDLENSQDHESMIDEDEEIGELDFDEAIAVNEKDNKEIEELANLEEDFGELDFDDELDESEFEFNKQEDSQSDEGVEDTQKKEQESEGVSAKEKNEQEADETEEDLDLDDLDFDELDRDDKKDTPQEEELKNDDKEDFGDLDIESEPLEHDKEKTEKSDSSNALEDDERSDDASLNEAKDSTATDELELDEELLEDDEIDGDDQESKYHESSDSLGIDEDELSEVKDLLGSDDEDDEIETEKEGEDVSDEVKVKNDEFSSLTEEALSEAVGEDLDFDDELDFGDEEVDNTSDINTVEDKTIIDDDIKNEEKTQQPSAEDSVSNMQQLQNIAGGMNIESIKKILDGMQVTINISYPNSKK